LQLRILCVHIETYSSLWADFVNKMHHCLFSVRGGRTHSILIILIIHITVSYEQNISSRMYGKCCLLSWDYQKNHLRFLTLLIIYKNLKIFKLINILICLLYYQFGWFSCQMNQLYLQSIIKPFLPTDGFLAQNKIIAIFWYFKLILIKQNS